MSLVLAALGCGLTASPVAAAPRPTSVFPLTAYPDARCADGTPGVYYYRAGAPGVTTWVVYLEGDANCTSNSDCQKAYAKTRPHTTSTGFKVGVAASGLMSTDPVVNPALYNANLLYIHYCSKDDWSGAKSPLPETAFDPANASDTWYFQGRAIALAAVADVASRADTNFAAATTILFSGSSSGGVGIVYMINDLLPYVPAGSMALMALDGGYSQQIGIFSSKAPSPYASADNPNADSATAGIPFWNGHGETTCYNAAMAAGGDIGAQVACYDTSMLLTSGYVTIPTLVVQSELDTSQLTKHKITSKVLAQPTAQQSDYITYWAQSAVASMATSTALTSIYAPQRPTHTFFVGDAAYTYPEQFGDTTITPSAAVAAWIASFDPDVRDFGTAYGIATGP